MSAQHLGKSFNFFFFSLPGRACGARIVSRTDELREEDVGTGARLFEVKKIGDEYFTFITDCKEPKACTILLRGASKEILAVSNFQPLLSLYIPFFLTCFFSPPQNLNWAFSLFLKSPRMGWDKWSLSKCCGCSSKVMLCKGPSCTRSQKQVASFGQNHHKTWSDCKML